jgi:phosphatidate cytidylyltransferase
MIVKVLTGLVLAAIVLVVVLWAPYWILGGLLGLVVLMAYWEFLSMPSGADKQNPSGPTRGDRIAAGIAAALVLASAGFADPDLLFPALAASLMVGALVILLKILVTPLPIEHAAERAGRMLGGMVYVAFLGAIMLLIGRDEHGSHGRTILLIAGVVTWLNDTMAYFGGKLMGRHRMYPAVSPNKTWEGSVTGMLGSVGGVLLVRAIFWQDAPVASLIGFAIVGGALGQAGDLVESVFKRASSVKDSASLLPGHGGFLDRIDAFLFVAPVAYFWFLAAW